MKTHILGFPRIGINRELKKAVEAYWNRQIQREELEQARYAGLRNETQLIRGKRSLTPFSWVAQPSLLILVFQHTLTTTRC